MKTSSLAKVFGFLLLILSTNAFADPNCSGVADSSNWLDFNFKQACFKHDVCYSEGELGGLTKRECDIRFYHDMMSSCRGRRATCKMTAGVYYGAVSSSFFEDAFQAASKKARKIKKLALDNADDDLFKLLKKRFKGQQQWTRGFKRCVQLDKKRDYEKCMKELDLIEVPDMPFAYRMGGCNILGINWKKGHRAKNARKMERLTGADFKDIMNKKGGDPCKNLYPSDSY